MNKLVALLIACLFLSAAVALSQSAKPLAGYDIIVVQKIEVGSLAAGSGFPTGYEDILQKTTYSKLAASKLFRTVIDGTQGSPTGVAESKSSATADAAAPASTSEKKILLTGTIIGYDKGSRTARWMVGLGAGKSRVKVRFIATDSVTGQELWRTDQEGTFAGTFEIGGGSESKAVSESTRKVSDNLVKQIALAR